MTYVIRTIDEAAVGDPGAAKPVVADASPGYPCRRCLTDARVGETLLLASVDPFEADSVYRSRGPVYLHAERCPNADGATTLPPIVFQRPQAVRAYDSDAIMLGAELAEGRQLEDVITKLLANPDVSYLHVHNALPGCFNFRVERR